MTLQTSQAATDFAIELAQPISFIWSWHYLGERQILHIYADWLLRPARDRHNFPHISQLASWLCGPGAGTANLHGVDADSSATVVAIHLREGKLQISNLSIWYGPIVSFYVPLKNYTTLGKWTACNASATHYKYFCVLLWYIYIYIYIYICILLRKTKSHWDYKFISILLWVMIWINNIKNNSQNGHRRERWEVVEEGWRVSTPFRPFPAFSFATGRNHDKVTRRMF